MNKEELTKIEEKLNHMQDNFDKIHEATMQHARDGRAKIAQEVFDERKKEFYRTDKKQEHWTENKTWIPVGEYYICFDQNDDIIIIFESPDALKRRERDCSDFINFQNELEQCKLESEKRKVISKYKRLKYVSDYGMDFWLNGGKMNLNNYVSFTKIPNPLGKKLKEMTAFIQLKESLQNAKTFEEENQIIEQALQEPIFEGYDGDELFMVKNSKLVAPLTRVIERDIEIPKGFDPQEEGMSEMDSMGWLDH